VHAGRGNPAEIGVEPRLDRGRVALLQRVDDRLIGGGDGRLLGRGVTAAARSERRAQEERATGAKAARG
jgi:hypothetical protein